MKLIFRKIYYVDTVENTQKALMLIEQNRYDALLVDINLDPRMDGIAFLQAVNTFPDYIQVPKIAVTAYATAGQKGHFLSHGFTHYITKPFFRKEIIQLVQHALSGSLYIA